MTELRHPEWGPHVKGLAHPKTVIDWGPVQETRIRMLQASRMNALMGVFGPNGTGKSHASGRAAEACEMDSERPAQVVFAKLPRSTAEKELLVSLYPQIVGVPAPTGRNVHVRDLIVDIHLALCERHRVIVLDEGQFITRQALLTLRWFFDDYDTDFALVIIGTRELRSRLALEIRSRGSKVVEFDLVPDNRIVEFLEAYDKLFESADPNLLQRRNHSHAHGQIRWWAYFLREAQQYLPDDGSGKLTDELVEICAAGVPRM